VSLFAVRPSAVLPWRTPVAFKPALVFEMLPQRERRWLILKCASGSLGTCFGIRHASPVHGSFLSVHQTIAVSLLLGLSPFHFYFNSSLYPLRCRHSCALNLPACAPVAMVALMMMVIAAIAVRRSVLWIALTMCLCAAAALLPPMSGDNSAAPANVHRYFLDAFDSPCK